MTGQVLKTILRYNMLPPAARAGVAVSGGADSVALLHVLHRLAGTRRWSLQVLHYDHQLRGDESDADARFVRELAASLGLECHCESADVRSAGGNLEQTARRLRYRFFAECRERLRLDAVATGHTASDQAETVLLRLLRGASTDSLAGIRALRDGWIVRPLLESTRAEVRSWLRSEGIAWREDSSNADNCYDRNRLRTQVLPVLQSEWNPRLEGALARLAEVAGQDEDYWRGAVDALARDAVRPHRLGVVVDVERLRAVHPALQSRLWRRVCGEVLNGEAGAAPPRLTHEHLTRLLSLAAQAEGDGRVSLPGLSAWRSFSQVLLHKPLGPTPEGGPVELSAPGEAALSAGGVRVCASRPGVWGEDYNEDSCSLLEGRLAPGPFLLRPWRGGDRYEAAAQGRGASLHDFLQAKRVPAWERPGWPVLEFAGQVVWTRALGVAPRWRATPGSAHVIAITEQPAPSRA